MTSESIDKARLRRLASAKQPAKPFSNTFDSVVSCNTCANRALKRTAYCLIHCSNYSKYEAANVTLHAPTGARSAEGR